MNFKKLLTQSIVWRGLYFATLFLVNVVLSRLLHADGTGKIYFISNTFALIQLIAGFCLECGITYFAASKSINANQLLWLCLVWTGGVAFFLLLILAVWGNALLHLYAGINVPLYAFCFIIGLLLTNYGCNLFMHKAIFYNPMRCLR